MFNCLWQNASQSLKNFFESNQIPKHSVTKVFCAKASNNKNEMFYLFVEKNFVIFGMHTKQVTTLVSQLMPFDVLTGTRRL